MKERVDYITLDQFPDLSSVMHEALNLFNIQLKKNNTYLIKNVFT